jgi:YbbR domain-containing protein
VTRALQVLVHNWPLKLAAIGLASLLYGGVVLTQNSNTFSVPVPVLPRNIPPNAVLLTLPRPTQSIRYFAPSDVPAPTASSFTAFVDLTGIEPNGQIISRPIQVENADPRIQILGVDPPSVNVQLDAFTTRTIPVEIDQNVPPPGLTAGVMEFVPAQIEVSGAKSLVDKVVKATGSVVIQEPGLDIDQDVDVIPVDSVGNRVSPVDLSPGFVHVTLPVFSDRQSRTLPVKPVISGTPAPGFEVESVTVTPTVVTVEGDADQLAVLQSVNTMPVSINGASSALTRTADLDLPAGVVPVGDAQVSVEVTFRPVTSTRTFEAGVQLVGDRADLAYSIDVDRIIATIGGSVADLDRLEGSSLVLDLDVAGVGPGTTAVKVTAVLPAGLTLVTANPASVLVTVTERVPASPSPSPADVTTSPSPVGG